VSVDVPQIPQLVWMMAIRIGVVGAGTIGRLRADSIRENAATELVAVCDVNPVAAAAARADSSAVVVNDLEAFFRVPMDVAVISSPIQLHEEACLAAFARGIHVLCEKPLSNTMESCERIIAAARAAGRILAVGFNLRYYPAMQYVRQVVDAGTIGPIDHVRVFGGHDGLANFRADWQYRAPVSGGGAMMDVGIHMTDLARYFLGEITDVYGMMSESVWNVPGSEDNAIAIFRNAAGVSATYQATWTEWQGYEAAIEVYGPLGMVRGSYAPMSNLLITHDKPGGARRRQRRRYLDVMVREKFRTWMSTTRATFDLELTDLLARIAGRPSGALADGHAGLRTLQIADAVRRSSASREAVHLPPLGSMWD
jgi:predicted dehydrogenase